MDAEIASGTLVLVLHVHREGAVRVARERVVLLEGRPAPAVGLWLGGFLTAPFGSGSRAVMVFLDDSGGGYWAMAAVRVVLAVELDDWHRTVIPVVTAIVVDTVNGLRDWRMTVWWLRRRAWLVDSHRSWRTLHGKMR